MGYWDGSLKGGGHMKFLGKSALLMLSLATVTVISAPVADARPNCNTADGGATRCETSGSTSIKARPGTTAPPGFSPQIPWRGSPNARDERRANRFQ